MTAMNDFNRVCVYVCVCVCTQVFKTALCACVHGYITVMYVCVCTSTATGMYVKYLVE